jgi:hypothetical protein
MSRDTGLLVFLTLLGFSEEVYIAHYIIGLKLIFT